MTSRFAQFRLALTLFAWIPALASCAGPPRLADQSWAPPERDLPVRFALLGNPRAGCDGGETGARLVRHMVRHDPAFLILGGSLTDRGAREADWEQLEDMLAPALRLGISVFPGFGARDFATGDYDAHQSWARRFPGLSKQKDYSVRYANVMILFLDTTQAEIGLFRQPQYEWLVETLERADTEANVSAIFAVVHRGLWSNAPGFEAPRTLRRLLAPIVDCRKTRIVVATGEATYQRIHRDGIWWITSGGGSSRSVALQLQPGKRHALDRCALGATRPPHYLRFTSTIKGFSVDMIGPAEAGAELTVLDHLEESFDKPR